MSRELIASYYRAFNARDYAAMLALLADDVAHDVNQGLRELGKERFASFLQRMDECYREQLSDLLIMADASNTRFAAEFTVLGSYLKADAGLPEAHGQRYTLPAGAFLTVEAGKIGRVTTYYNLSDWLAQVSLEGASARSEG
jgi:steroid delta-isomerase-like uncharacterized protein